MTVASLTSSFHNFEATGLSQCFMLLHCTALIGWLRGPAVEHRSLADVLSLSCARLVADG